MSITRFIFIYILVFAPHISFAYLSPSIVALLAASSTGLLVAVAACGLMYLIITIEWINRHRWLVLSILCIGGLLVVWNVHQSFQEYSRLKDINSFDGSVLVDHFDSVSSWETFFIEYAEERNGIQLDAYYADGEISINNIKRLIPSLRYNEIDTDKQTILGTYCLETNLQTSYLTSCALINAALNNPNDGAEINHIMNELGLDKNDPIVTLCSNGLRSSIVGVVLDKHGYKVDGHIRLVDEPDLYQSASFTSSNLGQLSRIITPFDYQPDKHHVVFTTSEDDYEVILDASDYFLPLADADRLSIVLLPSAYHDQKSNPAELSVFTNDHLRHKPNNFNFIESTVIDLSAVVTDPETVMVCFNPLSCVVVRSYLDQVGSPVRTLTCLDCGVRNP
jgi:rhodanese-related sulfurtransferase